MATVGIVLAQAGGKSSGTTEMPIPKSTVDAAESVTTSGVSAQSALVANAVGLHMGQVWIITASGGNIWAKFGANPTALVGGDWLILDGQTREFAVSRASEKCALIG